MPSFDVTSEVDWQEVDNARNQALKEVTQRFDFKGVQASVDVDTKEKRITLTSSRDDKIDAFVDVFKGKLTKRGLSLLAFDFQKSEPSAKGGARQQAMVQSGIDTEKAKKIVKAIKEKKFKAQAQIQDTQVRVTSKKRDELQEVIAFLKDQQNQFKLPLQFGNFRD